MHIIRNSHRNEGGEEASVGWSLFYARAGVAGLKVCLHVFSLGLCIRSLGEALRARPGRHEKGAAILQLGCPAQRPK